MINPNVRNPALDVYLELPDFLLPCSVCAGDGTPRGIHPSTGTGMGENRPSTALTGTGTGTTWGARRGRGVRGEMRAAVGELVVVVGETATPPRGRGKNEPRPRSVSAASVLSIPLSLRGKWGRKIHFSLFLRPKLVEWHSSGWIVFYNSNLAKPCEEMAK